MKKIVLKLSGEILQGKDRHVDIKYIENLAKDIFEIVKKGYKIALVIGGGNIWRHRDNADLKMDRVHSDQIGMMATIMNALILEDMFKEKGLKVKAVSALSARAVLPDYEPKKAVSMFKKYDVLICAGGTGKPYVTTDSAAALRAVEVGAEALLKATNVDFVYNKDPRKFKDAKPIKSISAREVVEKKLGVMDLSAVSLCMSKKIPIFIFNIFKKGNLLRAVFKRDVGTIIN
ncbi:MAG: uridylate kinase, uridylate kinase [Candidatus Peregrinibacteria bacterium GW2011_GWF2_38_29]|nr:MAG: uridylate kinase, uridylate kinase [Candidatus Peregrinibacteria bacterium GW2011_GWF2_38_29]HBB02214.1 UMP kinase [Candidatus Peregrinibacteria bacterium]